MLRSVFGQRDTIDLFEYVFLPDRALDSISFVCEQHPLGPHWRVIAAQTELIAKVYSGELALPADETMRAGMKTIDARQRNTSEDAIGEALKYHAMMGRRYRTGLEVLLLCLSSPMKAWTELQRPMHEFWFI